MDVAELNTSDGAASNNDRGVLANLPRTRPQRATARRAAARAKPGGAGRARSRTPTVGAGSPASTRTRPPAALRPAAERAEVPAQGYEADSEAATGSVQPPGAVELVASAAELVGELTKGGISRSERLIRDLVSRLPLS